MRVMLPTKVGFRGMIDFLKANRHAINYPGCSTMMIDYCRRKYVSHPVLETFLELGADVDMIDCNGENAIDVMILSTSHLNSSSLNLLLQASKHGVNRQCHHGGSYLFRANTFDKINQVVGTGIDVNLETNNGFTALDHMKGQLKWAKYADDHKEIIRYTNCVANIEFFGGKPGTSKDPRVQHFFF